MTHCNKHLHVKLLGKSVYCETHRTMTKESAMGRWEKDGGVEWCLHGGEKQNSDTIMVMGVREHCGRNMSLLSRADMVAAVGSNHPGF